MVVESPSLMIFKSCLDMVLGNWLRVVLLKHVEAGLGTCRLNKRTIFQEFPHVQDSQTEAEAWVTREWAISHTPTVTSLLGKFIQDDRGLCPKRRL